MGFVHSLEEKTPKLSTELWELGIKIQIPSIEVRG